MALNLRRMATMGVERCMRLLFAICRERASKLEENYESQAYSSPNAQRPLGMLAFNYIRVQSERVPQARWLEVVGRHPGALEWYPGCAPGE